jgi:hypothetical protein
MRLPHGKLARYALLAAAGLVVAAAVAGGIYWARYPKVPDLAKAPLDEAMRFTATDDFNRMAAWHRKRYLLGLVNRMHEKSFADLVSMMMSPDTDRKKQAQNMNLLSEADRKEIGGAWMRLFLDKFFDLSSTERGTYLTLFALAEKAGTSHHSADKGPPGMPTAAQIQKGMSDFLSEQPPHAAAQMDELMNEMNQKRQMLGIKGPWG